MTARSRWIRILRVTSITIVLASGALGMPTATEAQRSSPRGGRSDPAVDPSLAIWARAQLEEVNSSAAYGGAENLDRRLARIRAMYFLSVEEKDWLERARDSLAALEPGIPSGSDAEVTLQAYRGALEVVRAKHSSWPPNKLKYLSSGAAILDALVVQAPDDLEVRYLRLASYLFLPFFLRRDESVTADLGILSAGLPDHPEAFSPAVYQGVLRFVLANGGLEGDRRKRLEKVLDDPGWARLGNGS